MFILYLILIQILIFTAGRILFLGWNWTNFHHQSATDLLYAILHGFRFDLSAASLLTAPIFLIYFFSELPGLLWPNLNLSQRLKVFRDRFLVVTFVVVQFPGLVFHFVDCEFINFTGRRMTFDSLFYYTETTGKYSQIIGTYLNLLLIGLVVYAGYSALVWLTYKKRSSLPSSKRGAGALLAVLFLVILVGARGGLQKKPLGFAHAQIFAAPMMNSLVLNSSFSVLQTLKRQSLPRVKYFDRREEMLSLLPGAWSASSAMEGHRFSTPQNVVLLILESFNFDYMGRPFSDQGYTPFLDELAGRGIFMQNHFANARRSIEGIGAILAGIPAWMSEPFLSSQYMANYFLGLGSLLGKKHYQTAFFHGGQNGTMYFDSFTKSLGIEKYYGANEYPNKDDDDGVWGIYDGPFLSWMGKKFGEFHQPFFSAAFTLSSHNPYRIPDSAVGRFPKGTLDIHESIGYADQSLRDFFRQAEKEPWYENTLFVLTADHTYKNARPEFDNELGQHRIPLILFHPKWERNPKLRPFVDPFQVTSQIDILPTILDFLGAELPERNYLARSLFVPADRFAVTFVDGKYHLVTKDYFLTLSLDQKFRLYSRADANEQKEIEDNSELKEALSLKLKAAIQYFSEGLWDNRLYYPVNR